MNSPESPGAATAAAPPGVARWIPALGWLRRYQPSWLRGDLVAGITLGAYLLPAGLGDASLANLPPEAGLYACLFSGLVFWLFCSSRHTAITASGIKLQAVEARASVRDRLRKEGIDTKLGGINRWALVDDAVDAFQNPGPP